MPKSSVGDWKMRLREGWCKMGWKYRVKQALRRVIAVHKSLYYRLDRAQVRESDNAAELTTITSNEDSVEEIVRDLYGGNAKELAFYENYVRQGIEHWTALQNGKIVGVVWLYTGYYQASYRGFHIEIEPTAKFVCNVLVSPQFRGQGIFSIISQRCFAEYPESEFYSVTAYNNKISRRSHEKIGFRQCAAAYYLSLLGITFCYFVTQSGKRRFFKVPKGQCIRVSLTN